MKQTSKVRNCSTHTIHAAPATSMKKDSNTYIHTYIHRCDLDKNNCQSNEEKMFLYTIKCTNLSASEMYLASKSSKVVSPCETENESILKKNLKATLQKTVLRNDHAPALTQVEMERQQYSCASTDAFSKGKNYIVRRISVTTVIRTCIHTVAHFQ